LLSEKKRTNAYLQQKAMDAVADINTRTDESLDMMAALEGEVRRDLEETSDTILQSYAGGIDEANKKRRVVMGEMKEWHEGYVPIAGDGDEEEQDSGQELPWDKMMDDKEGARSKIREQFNDLMDTLTEKRQDLLALSEALRLQQIELDKEAGTLGASSAKFKLAATNHDEDEAKKHAAEKGAKEAAEARRVAAVEANNAIKHMKAHMEEWERLQDELRAQVAAMLERHAAELAELAERQAFELRRAEASG
jgi:hypothetical protein